MKLCGILVQFDDLKTPQLAPENQTDAVTAPSQLYDPSFVYESSDDERLPAVNGGSMGVRLPGGDDDQWRSYDPNSPQSPWWFTSEQGQTVGFRIVRPLKAPSLAQ